VANAITCIRDEKIGGLPTVLNPSELTKYLRPIVPLKWGALRDLELQVLKHHLGKRCTVNITLHTSTGKHELIGKVYAKDRSNVFRGMKQMSQSGFGPEAEFSIPQPLAFVPELGLLILQRVQGPLAREVCLTGNEDQRARAAERCACWLAYFQTRAPLFGPVRLLADEDIEKWVARLTRPHSELTGKAQLLLRQLDVTVRAVDDQQLCPCHFAYSDHQIIVTETRTVTFDLDQYCRAAPAWDVARFIISLQKLALRKFGSLRAFDPVVEVFYKTYTAKSRFNVTKDLPVYRAALCLRHSRDNLDPLLDEGFRILADEM